MKFKPTLGALIVALSLAGASLTGCFGGGEKKSSDDSQLTEKFFVSVPTNEEYTVSGLEAEGYVEGATVNFGITLTHPDDKAIRQVTATAGTNPVTVTATESGYTFRMPAHDVSIAITLRNIDRYALTYTGNANVDETITLELTLGNTPVAEDYVIAGKTAADQEKISVNGDKVTLLATGELTLVAKIQDEVKAELAITVSESLIMSIKDALDEAIVEAPFNGAGGASAAKSEAKTIAGQVLALSSYNLGCVQAILDDGTAAAVIQIAKNEADLDPVAIGDTIRVTTKFENYYGLLEGISQNATATSAPNIPQTDVIEINKTFTPKLATPENITSAQYDDYYTACAANGQKSGDNRTWNEIKNVNINVTFDSGTLFAIDGSAKKIDVKTSHDQGDSLDKVAGHKSTLTGFLLGVNSSSSKSNMIVMGQTGLAVESLSINEGESLSMFKNNEKQLTYTTVPTGSYGVETWVSSDPSIVTVENGLLRAVDSGEADVTLTINGQSASIHVTVSGEEIPATSVVLDKNTAEVEMGSTLTLVATTTPAVITDQAVWTSGDETIATVEDGVVTPVALGDTTITVTYREGVSASCTVTVKAKHGTTIEDPLTVAETMTIGKALPGVASQEVTTDIEYYTIGELTSITYAYNASSLNFSGMLGGQIELYKVGADESFGADLKAGAEIIVKGKIINYSNGYKIEYGQDASVQQYLSIVNGDLNKTVGDDPVQLTTATNFVGTITWASSETSIATVSETGLLTLVGAGATVITATVGTHVAKINVVVLSAGSVTASTTIAAYANANSWSNGTKYPTLSLDENITVTVTGGSNSGKYYTSGNEWRIYQTESPTIKVEGNDSDVTISFIKITYSIDKTGILLDADGNSVSSGTSITVGANSYTFGVGNSGTATNGQVKITAITVIYARVSA